MQEGPGQFVISIPGLKKSPWVHKHTDEFRFLRRCSNLRPFVPKMHKRICHFPATL